MYVLKIVHVVIKLDVQLENESITANNQSHDSLLTVSGRFPVSRSLVDMLQKRKVRVRFRRNPIPTRSD